MLLRHVSPIDNGRHSMHVPFPGSNFIVSNNANNFSLLYFKFHLRFIKQLKKGVFGHFLRVNMFDNMFNAR